MNQLNCENTILVSAALTRVVTRQPIPVTSLASHIERMHLNEDSGFSEEFKVELIFACRGDTC